MARSRELRETEALLATRPDFKNIFRGFHEHFGLEQYAKNLNGIVS